MEMDSNADSSLRRDRLPNYFTLNRFFLLLCAFATLLFIFSFSNSNVENGGGNGNKSEFLIFPVYFSILSILKSTYYFLCGVALFFIFKLLTLPLWFSNDNINEGSQNKYPIIIQILIFIPASILYSKDPQNYIEQNTLQCLLNNDCSNFILLKIQEFAKNTCGESLSKTMEGLSECHSMFYTLPYFCFLLTPLIISLTAFFLQKSFRSKLVKKNSTKNDKDLQAYSDKYCCNEIINSVFKED